MKLLDTNILIYLFEQSPKYFEKVNGLLSPLEKSFALSALTIFEILLGTEPEHHNSLQIFFQQFTIYPVSTQVSTLAAEIMIQQKKTSRQIKIDALIGATALFHSIPLVTNNPKDFSWIKGLRIETL